LAACAKAVGQISGGCLNPAVGLSQSVGQMMGYNNKNDFRVDQWNTTMPMIYTLGPFAGALIAGFYTFLNRLATQEFFDDPSQDEEKQPILNADGQ